MDYLSQTTYQSWLSGARILEQDGHGLKVLQLQDGSIVKMYRLKRLLSSQLLYPQARRFQRNTELLKSIGIPCPTPIEIWRLQNPPRNLIHYWPLPGQTLRDMGRKDPQKLLTLLPELGTFIARLHELGVYFRSLHLGNIVLTPEGHLGLIDLADLHKRRLPLSDNRRLRNLWHLFRYREDWIPIEQSAIDAMAEAYGEVSPRPVVIQRMRLAHNLREAQRA